MMSQTSQWNKDVDFFDTRRQPSKGRWCIPEVILKKEGSIV